MLTNFLQSRRLTRVQRKLGPQLLRDYGSAEGYTAAQIAHAMQRAKLPEGDRQLACAAFMGEAAFNAAFPAPRQSHAAYREALQRYAIRRGGSAGVEPASENFYAASAAPSILQG